MIKKEMDTSKYYVFYDGDCGFCNFWVQWILKKDLKDQFMFASLQSDFGQEFLKERGLETQQLSTLYLWKPQSFYLKKSEAALKIASILGGKYSFIGYLRFIPKSISDFFYDKIAENRKKLATNTCFLPNEKERAKFV
jgi:predicted DCC family thiol-disulfide oxidoreductase YuxK